MKKNASEHFKKMAEAYKVMSRKNILVGWVDPNQKHEISDGGMPISLGKIARIQCTGWEAGVSASGKSYPRLPARNFFKVARNLYKKRLDELTGKILIAVSNVKMSSDKASLQLAEFWKARIQQAMRKSDEYEKLSEATIKARKRRNKTLKAKEANKPLIDTATLINSITYKVT